jgi:hypothetical protein
MKNSLCFLIGCVVTIAVFTSGSVFGQAGSISSVVASYPTVVGIGVGVQESQEAEDERAGSQGQVTTKKKRSK